MTNDKIAHGRRACFENERKCRAMAVNLSRKQEQRKPQSRRKLERHQAITFRLSQDTIDRLKAMADYNGLHLSDQLTLIIKAEYRKMKRRIDYEETPKPQS